MTTNSTHSIPTWSSPPWRRESMWKHNRMTYLGYVVLKLDAENIILKPSTKNIYIYIYICKDISWILFFRIPSLGNLKRHITKISYKCCPPLLPKDCSDWQVRWYPSRLLRPSMPMVVSHSDSRGDSPKGVAWITCNDNICVHMHIFI